MIRDITIGQYYPANSKLHRLDPRVKIMCTLFYLISLFLFKIDLLKRESYNYIRNIRFYIECIWCLFLFYY